MKNRKKLFGVILTLSLVFSLFTWGNTNYLSAKAKPRLSKKKITLTVGKKKKLKLKNYKKKVKWSSSKKKVATVNKKGVVTAKKKGTAKITAKAGKKKYVCKVTVKEKTKKKTQETNVEEQQQMEDIPKFLNFKSYEGEEIITKASLKDTFTLLSDEDGKHKWDISKVWESLISIKNIENTCINKEERVFLMLSYENKKRDSIVEIVLNDSDYGEKQIYTTAASVNKILSSDTYYDSEKESYITDVLLYLPETKEDSTTRTIDIEESCFLRETTGVRGYADLSKARSTSVKFEVASEPVPNSVGIFNFEENDHDGYTVTGLNSNYDIPEIIYVPSTYKGMPVNELGTAFLGSHKVTKLIIPESVTDMRTMVTDTPEEDPLEEVYILAKKAPKLHYYSGKGYYYLEFQYGKYCNVIVPEEAVESYINDSKTSDYSWRVTYNNAKHILYYMDENNERKPFSAWEEAQE